MKVRKFPTYGQLFRYLEDLGFTHRLWEFEGITRHVYEHAASGCQLVFRDHPAGEMARGGDVLNVHHQFWWRSLIDDDVDVYQFLANFVTAGKAGKAG